MERAARDCASVTWGAEWEVKSIIDPPGIPSVSWQGRALERTITGGLVGLLVSSALILWSWWAPENPVAVRGVDIVMRIYAGSPERRLDIPRYVFIDADNDTCADLKRDDWNACDADGAVLRTRYTKAINQASDYGASLILLDFDLTRSARYTAKPAGPPDGMQCITERASEVDRKLEEALSQSHAPIFVARPLRYTISNDDAQTKYNPLDTVIDDYLSRMASNGSSPSRIRFGHVTWLPDDNAGTIRRLPPCLCARTAGGKDIPIPPITLLSTGFSGTLRDTCRRTTSYALLYALLPACRALLPACASCTALGSTPRSGGPVRRMSMAGLYSPTCPSSMLRETADHHLIQACLRGPL
jgi:hypothetical protein